MTFVFNIPLNDKLPALDAKDPASEALLREYLSKWTMWNHVRTTACTAAAVLPILASRSI